jgi:hypothetical protein
MIQPTIDTYLFRLGRSSYERTRLRGLLWLAGFFSCACLALLLSAWLVTTYAHTFVPYLKWQDAMVSLFWAVACFSLIGCVFTLRFLSMLHLGYARSMLTLVKDKYLLVRDLSHENLTSGFWMIHAPFWCFVAVLVGLLPEMLLSWTLSIPNPVLMVFVTGVTLLLGIAGLAVSVIFGSFIVVGFFGAVSFYRNLGIERMYPLNDHTTLRLDDAILTITSPRKPESMIDLTLLDPDDRRSLLALLHDHLDIQHPQEEQEEAIPLAAGYDAVLA